MNENGGRDSKQINKLFLIFSLISHASSFMNILGFFYFSSGFAEESTEPIRAGGLRELK